MVDFHVHSIYSDGTDTLNSIFKKAEDVGIEYLSITDHDTIGSQEEALNLSKDYNISYISGIEISAEHPLTLHILGYNYDIYDTDFSNQINELKIYRDKRNLKIVKNFQDLGFDITLDEVISKAKGNIVGRPHFASVLVEKGYFNDRKEVFDKFLSKGKPAYENKKRFSIEKSIQLIHNANGLAVWAHPYSAVTNSEELVNLARKLADYGIDGLEVYYSSYDENMISNLREVANKFNLFCTAGSDYHGKNKTVPLGVNIDKDSIRKFFKRLNLGG
jgi:predicted metal-dependent phosphoesterase TrpH